MYGAQVIYMYIGVSWYEKRPHLEFHIQILKEKICGSIHVDILYKQSTCVKCLKMFSWF